MRPRVFLVGAGPGDPELLTVKALKILGAARVVLHDSLVSPAILDLAPRTALRLDVGKRCGRHSAPQAEINRLLVAHARSGAVTVRLKGGDPLIFGRAGEEMQALEAHGIAYEIVPGITAAAAAAATLRLPLTRRGCGRSVHFLTGHGAVDGLPAHDWAALARAGGTLAVYMGRETVVGLTAHLIEAGLPAGLPPIAIENVSLAGERRFGATLASLPGALRAAAGSGPLLILIGEALHDPSGPGMPEHAEAMRIAPMQAAATCVRRGEACTREG